MEAVSVSTRRRWDNTSSAHPGRGLRGSRHPGPAPTWSQGTRALAINAEGVLQPDPKTAEHLRG